MWLGWNVVSLRVLLSVIEENLHAYDEQIALFSDVGALVAPNEKGYVKLTPVKTSPLVPNKTSQIAETLLFCSKRSLFLRGYDQFFSAGEFIDLLHSYLDEMDDDKVRLIARTAEYNRVALTGEIRIVTDDCSQNAFYLYSEEIVDFDSAVRHNPWIAVPGIFGT